MMGRNSGSASIAATTVVHRACCTEGRRRRKITTNAARVASSTARVEVSANCVSNCPINLFRMESMPLPPLGFSIDLSGEAPQLARVHDFAVDHADDQLFDRARAEAVNNLLHGADGETARTFDAGVDVGAALDFVAEVTLGLQAPQQRSYRGLF